MCTYVFHELPGGFGVGLRVLLAFVFHWLLDLVQLQKKKTQQLLINSASYLYVEGGHTGVTPCETKSES